MLTVRHIRFRPGRFLSSAKQFTNQRTAFDSAANEKRVAYLWRGCRWSVWLSSQQWRSDWVWSWQQTEALYFYLTRWFWMMRNDEIAMTCLIIMLQLSNILSWFVLKWSTQIFTVPLVQIAYSPLKKDFGKLNILYPWSQSGKVDCDLFMFWWTPKIPPGEKKGFKYWALLIKIIFLKSFKRLA